VLENFERKSVRFDLQVNPLHDRMGRLCFLNLAEKYFSGYCCAVCPPGRLLTDEGWG